MWSDLGEDSRMQGCALNGILQGARAVLLLRVRRSHVSGERNEAGIHISQDGRCWVRFMIWATFRCCLCAGMIRQWSYFFNVFITLMEWPWVVMLFYDILYLQQESMCWPGQLPGIQGLFCLSHQEHGKTVYLDLFFIFKIISCSFYIVLSWYIGYWVSSWFLTMKKDLPPLCIYWYLLLE